MSPPGLGSAPNSSYGTLSGLNSCLRGSVDPKICASYISTTSNQQHEIERKSRSVRLDYRVPGSATGRFSSAIIATLADDEGSFACMLNWPRLIETNELECRALDIPWLGCGVCKSCESWPDARGFDAIVWLCLGPAC